MPVSACACMRVCAHGHMGERGVLKVTKTGEGPNTSFYFLYILCKRAEWGGEGRNVKQYPDAKQVDGLLVVRIDAPLFFANVPKVKDDLYDYERRAEAAHKARGTQLKFLIIDLSPVTDIDASAVHWLEVCSGFVLARLFTSASWVRPAGNIIDGVAP